MVGFYLTQTLFTAPSITRPQTDSFSGVASLLYFPQGHCSTVAARVGSFLTFVNPQKLPTVLQTE